MNIGGLPVWLGYCFLISGCIGFVFILAALCVFVWYEVESLELLEVIKDV